MGMRSWVDLDKLFEQELPFEFLEKFVVGLPTVYKAAWDHVWSHFAVPQAWDLLPHVRRAFVEDHLWRTGNRFKDLTADALLNVARNCRHVEIRSDSIVLTANAVNAPGAMVRDARFRSTLAEPNQDLLFPELDDRPRGDFYYAMVLHGPQFDDESRVAFVQLAFPSHDSRRYVGGPYDLVSFCNADLYPEAKEEAIQDNAAPQLRREIRVKGE